MPDLANKFPKTLDSFAMFPVYLCLCRIPSLVCIFQKSWLKFCRPHRKRDYDRAINERFSGSARENCPAYLSYASAHIAIIKRTNGIQHKTQSRNISEGRFV